MATLRCRNLRACATLPPLGGNRPTAMTLVEKQEQLTATLSRIRDAQERFAYLVERGRKQEAIEAASKSDAFKVVGCLSNLWLVPRFRDGKCYFQSDADSVIVKAIAGLLCEFYSGHGPEEILSIDPSFLGRVGITQHLTPNRRNALSRVWEKIRDFALSHQPPSPVEGNTERA